MGGRRETAGAGDDRHTPANDSAERLDVSRVEVQLQIEDGAVEVEGQQAVARTFSERSGAQGSLPWQSHGDPSGRAEHHSERIR